MRTYRRTDTRRSGCSLCNLANASEKLYHYNSSRNDDGSVRGSYSHTFCANDFCVLCGEPTFCWISWTVTFRVTSWTKSITKCTLWIIAWCRNPYVTLPNDTPDLEWGVRERFKVQNVQNAEKKRAELEAAWNTICQGISRISLKLR